MSTGGSYRGMSESARPIIAPGATAQFYPITYSSAAYEPDVNLSLSAIPPSRLTWRSVIVLLFAAICSALKPAQLRKALLNVLLVGGAVGMIVVMAVIALVVPYLVFFAEF